MKRIFTFIASAVLAVSATAAPAPTQKEHAKSALSHTAFRFAPKAKADMRESGIGNRAGKSMQQRANGNG